MSLVSYSLWCYLITDKSLQILKFLAPPKFPPPHCLFLSTYRYQRQRVTDQLPNVLAFYYYSSNWRNQAWSGQMCLGSQFCAFALGRAARQHGTYRGSKLLISTPYSLREGARRKRREGQRERGGEGKDEQQ